MRSQVTTGLGFLLCLVLGAGCTGSSKPTGTSVAVDISGDFSAIDSGPGMDISGPVIAGCDDPGLVANARDVLERSCYPCHGLLGQSKGGMGHVLDVDQLIASGQVKPGDPDGSSLYIRMDSRQMPPENTDAPLPTDADIDQIERWIFCGAQPLYTEETRTFIAPSDVTGAIGKDLEALPASQRAFARYFSLVNLYNAGIPSSDLKVYRGGLAKMVNSLSLGSVIVNPVAINETETIYRIYTDDYGWDYNPDQDVDIWESIVREYAYGVRYEDDLYDQNIEALSGTRMAYVNADWFVSASSQPRLYHVILQLPNSASGLEQMVGVDTVNNLSSHADGLRAGFTQSGASNNNRIIERHDANMGAFWRSFDFASESGHGNVLYFSMGPQGLSFTEEENDQFFAHDGGEFIFELPNGLHGYMITALNGCRHDQAPTNLIDSPEQPEGSLVENGYSCMHCHREGIVPTVDDVRPHWETFGVGAPNYTPDGPLNGKEYIDEIYEFYVPQDQMTDKQNADRAEYQDALESTGAVFGEYDPVSLLKFEFDEDLDRYRVAAELGVTPEEFEDYVVSFPQISGLVGGAINATVGRVTFEENFAEIVCTIFLGDPLKFHEACGGTCTPDCGDAICGDHDGCGGTCGQCDPGHECVAGACYPVCGAAELCAGVVCDDGVDCTADTCDIASGGCVFTTVNGACADGNKCNGKEICDPVVGCLAGEPPDCDDQVLCTVDSCDPFEICLHTPDDAQCDDGDPCNGVDLCEPGVGCLVGPPSACDDGVDCTTDLCDDVNGCLNTPVDAACDDGVDCTTDTCDPVTGCESTPGCDDGIPCTIDSCEPGLGCVHTPDHGGCSDGDFCSGEEVCDPVTGCQAGPDLDCGDGLDCTTDSCDPLVGCSNAPDDTQCGDGVLCTTDTCDGLLGCVNLVDDQACSDGLGCTVDVCDASTGCSSTPSTALCDDGIFCTVDACSAVTGCSHTTDDSACDDGIGCTVDDCGVQSGCLYSTESALCDDGIDCTLDSCSAVSDCVHDTSNCSCLLNVDCDDGSACTTDVCDGGSCSSTPIAGCCTTNVECADANPCSSDLCADNVCSNAPIEGCCTDNNQCDDANLCTDNACVGNVCSFAPIEGCCTDNNQCDDANPCTDDSCAGTSCAFAPIEGCCTDDIECDDANPCTDESCADNACSFTAIEGEGCCNINAECDDANPCTNDLCTNALCSNAPIADCCTDNAQCDDANPCTDDSCGADNGCTNSALDGCCTDNTQCDDANPCTDDVCTADNACSLSNIAGCCVINEDCKPPAHATAICVDNQCEVSGCEPSCTELTPCWFSDGCGGFCSTKCQGDTTCWDLDAGGFEYDVSDPLVGCMTPQQYCQTAGYKCGAATGLEVSVDCENVNGPCPADTICNQDTHQCESFP